MAIVSITCALRYYSAEIRRFVNQDILLGNIADGQSLNRFAFVTGNPVSFVDPFGLSEMLGGEYYGDFDPNGITYLGLYDTLMSPPYVNYTIINLITGFWSSANTHLVGMYIGSTAWGPVNISQYCSEYINAPEIRAFIRYAKLSMELHIKQSGLDKLPVGQSVTFSIHDQTYHYLSSSIYAFGSGLDQYTLTATVTGQKGGGDISYFIYMYRKDEFTDPLDIYQHWEIGKSPKSPIANLYLFAPYDFEIGCLCE